MKGTGTVMANRIKGIPHSGTKLDRGESNEYVRIIDDKIVIVEWQDNRKVLLASTCSGVEPATVISRWSKKDDVFVDVTCPAIVKHYNANMGGVGE